MTQNACPPGSHLGDVHAISLNSVVVDRDVRGDRRHFPTIAGATFRLVDDLAGLICRFARRFWPELVELLVRLASSLVAAAPGLAELVLLMKLCQYGVHLVHG